MIRYLFYTALIAFGATGALAWKFANDSATAKVSNSAPTATQVAVGNPWIEGIGYVEPRSEILRLTFKTGGVIVRCSSKPGVRLRKGEVIAQLDDAAIKVSVEGSKRRLDVARAELANVKAGVNPYRIQAAERTVEKLKEHARHLRGEADRLKKMFAGSSVSQTDYAEATTKALQAEIALKENEAELLHLRNMATPEQVAVAEAKVRQAECDLVEVEQRLADTRLLAPLDGIVLRYLKREGEGVSPLMPPEAIALFGDTTRLRVRAEVDERHVRHLAVGRKVEIYGRNLGSSVYAGVVFELERAMGDKTVFARAASERKDLHVLQFVVEMGSDFSAPVGLQVDVRVARE